MEHNNEISFNKLLYAEDPDEIAIIARELADKPLSELPPARHIQVAKIALCSLSTRLLYELKDHFLAQRNPCQHRLRVTRDSAEITENSTSEDDFLREQVGS